MVTFDSQFPNFYGILVESQNLKSALHNQRAIVCGVALQFLVLPFLGFCAVKLFLDDQKDPRGCIALTLLVVTSSPGGSYSNWWCSLFNADLGLSVTMTAISTVLSAVMLPLNLILYANLASVGEGPSSSVVESIDWRSLFTALAVVIFAIACGLYFSFQDFSNRYRLIANRLGMLSGIALITFGFIASNFTTSSQPNENEESPQLWDKDLSFYVGVAFPCFAAIILSSILATFAKLSKPERVTVAVECSYQNPGIATSVAIAMFSDPTERALALGVPLYYGFVEAVICGIYCILCWKFGWTKAPTDENMWIVMLKSYEVEEIESRSDMTKDGDDQFSFDKQRLPYNKDDNVGMNDSSNINTNNTRARLFTGDSTVTAVTNRTERIDSADVTYMNNYDNENIENCNADNHLDSSSLNNLPSSNRNSPLPFWKSRSTSYADISSQIIQEPIPEERV